MRDKMLFLAGGFVGALVSCILPSLATQYWMWKERESYRWVLILSWVLVLATLFVAFLYLRGK